MKYKKIFYNEINEINKSLDIFKKSKDFFNLRVFYNLVLDTIKRKKKIFFIGNGGSAADSQHFATEFLVRYQKERRALPVIALTSDTSVITAISNDYDFNQIFKRQLEGLANKGDLLISLSTSGNSTNVIEAIKFANKIGCNTFSLLGNNGGKIKNFSKKFLIIPSKKVSAIQTIQKIILHSLCEFIDGNIPKR